MDIRFSDKSILPVKTISQAGLRFAWLENGALFSLMHGETLINQALGHPLEGNLGNVYVRLWQGDRVRGVPMTGPEARTEFAVDETSARWTGTVQGLKTSCRLLLDPDQPRWFWELTLTNTTRRPLIVDALLAQDLGLAGLFGVRLNEAYTSQYIDHTVYRDPELGYCICSRQNQSQNGAFPWILHGCLDRAVGFATDGFQFYGLEYKETNRPAALTRPRLPNEKWQYEFAMAALQSAKTRIPAGGSRRITFCAVYLPDHPAATSSRDTRHLAAAAKAYRRLSRRPEGPAAPVTAPETLLGRPRMFSSLDLSEADLVRHFGKERRHPEKRGGKWLSFFREDHAHVVLKAKERLVERPHGHILRSGQDHFPSDEILSTTSWMNGVFNSQITIGNTSFNKLLSVVRNPLNILKTSGQRVFVKTSRGLELLGLPSAFETGLNHARWIYKGKELTVIAKVWTSLDEPAVFLSLETGDGSPAEFVIVQHLVLGNNEWDSQGRAVIDPDAGSVRFEPADSEMMAQRYPESVFWLVTPDRDRVEALAGDGPLYADGRERGLPVITLKTKPSARFTLAFTGGVLDRVTSEGRARRFQERVDSLEKVQDGGRRFWAGLAQGASLRGPRRDAGASKLDDLLYWYLHNAMVHYTTPHGLEQYSGAAWGLRDVCQGPVEFLMAVQAADPLKQVLRTVYAHQYQGTGDWPQWFMFDRYQEVQSHESHADIIVWPLKALCDYVESTNDVSILREPVAYTDDQTFRFTERTEPIVEHTDRQIDKMLKDCIPGTALVSYGHGDWEDTLQPADPSMRARLVSAWTVELVYQTMRRWQRVCERAGETKRAARARAFAERIQADFNRHLVKDGVVTGLAHFGDRRVELMLHPRDRKTGVHYRLLPMTRGMIAGIFTPEQVRRHAAVIFRSLHFPDGVRLMDRPIAYRGGVEKYFKRAETASNFGREIGLQYVHAHIRFIEAMAKLGRAEDLHQALLAITPITLDQVVPTAAPRQANAYFSSSDAAFLDRYQAERQFGKIKKLEVPVKGGWRIYSSGPGIFLNQLISGALGLRRLFDQVLLDPVLPKAWNGLSFDFAFEGRPVRYVYHVERGCCSPRRVTVNGREVGDLDRDENPYRPGGVLIGRERFLGMLDQPRNVVDIYL